MTRHCLRHVLLLIGVLLATAGPDAAKSAEPRELAANLVRLRGEVEQLNAELALARDEQRAALQSMLARKAELEGQLGRQELATREARTELAQIREKAQAMDASAGSLDSVVNMGLQGLARAIRSMLPFKRDDRLAEIERIRTEMAQGTLPSARAVNRVWALFEDELRATRDIAIHSQTIELGDGPVLAEVAKLGNMQLYFATRDGRFGQAVQQGKTWKFIVAEREADRKNIASLFDALRKQLRQGWFELPQLAASSGPAPGATP